MRQQGYVEGWYLRGGTSKGLFVHESDLPVDGDVLDALLLEVYGTPDPLQVDGIGGSKSHTSKFMCMDPSDRDGVDVDYTFGQVGVTEATVDWSANCGNLTSAVGVFALLEGLVTPTEPTTELSLYNTNTDTLVTQEVPVTDGEPALYGEYSIDGVPGTGAKISSEFHDPAGGTTGSLLPTGNPRDAISVDGREVEVTVVDATNLVAFVHADDVGMVGHELPDEMEATPEIVEAFEAIRSEVAGAVGVDSLLGVAAVAPPMDYECSVDERVSADGIDLTSRIVTLQPHHAYAMTGAMCLGAATTIPGTIPNRCAGGAPADGVVTIGHPKGTVSIGVDATVSGDEVTVESITNFRTARPLLRGQAYYRYVDGLSAPDER